MSEQKPYYERAIAQKNPAINKPDKEYVLGGGEDSEGLKQVDSQSKLNVESNNFEDILEAKGLEKKDIPEDHYSNLHSYDKVDCKNSGSKGLNPLNRGLNRVKVEKWEGITLVGKGEKKDDLCGEYLPLEFCASCGRPHLVKNTCGGGGARTCPNCWNSWRKRRLKDSLVRLIGKDLYLDKQKMGGTLEVKNRLDFEEYLKGYRWVHATASLRGVTAKIEKIREYRKEAIDKLKEWGLSAGMVIFHPFRVDSRYKDKFEKGWYDLREREDWEDFAVWSPHFHIVGLVGPKDEWSRLSDGNLVSGDWVLKRIRDFEGLEDLAKGLNYILSHTGVDEYGHLHSITWFGNMAYNQFNPEDSLSRGNFEVLKDKLSDVLEIEKTDLECPECGGISFILISKVQEWLLDNPDNQFGGLLQDIYEWYINGGVKTGPPAVSVMSREVNLHGSEEK